MSLYLNIFNNILTQNNRDSDDSGKPNLKFLILLFFFFSGAAGLIYEVVWNRMLGLVFGSTVYAATTVLTVFMAGMALGGFYFGRIVDKRGNPLRIYSYLQLGIGVFALILPFLLDGIGGIYVIAYRRLHTSFYALSLIKFILCFLVLIIPTTLMGGTMPAISKFLASKTSRLGWNIGLIYAVNTFGAVLGCFMAGFVFVRIMGVSGTIYLAAGVNFLIFLGTFLLSRGNSLQSENGKNDLEKQVEGTYLELPEWSSRLAIYVIGISGFCALAYEVLWTRVLALFLGSTNYAFATMLSAFLCGLALGSFILSRFIDERKDLLTILSLVQIGIGLCAVLLVPTFGRLYSLGSLFTKPSWWTFISSRFSLSFLVMLLPTMLMGATFPLVVKIYTGKRVGSLGRSVGNVYSVNTLGSILGSFLAGFLLIPHIGIQRTIVILAFINAAVGVTIMILNIVYAKPGSSGNVLRVSVLIASVVIILLGSVLIDLSKPLTYYTAIFKGPGASNKLLLYKEDVDACVTVVEDFEGVRRIFVDANQAAEDSRWDLPSHSVIGHLPLLLHPDPKTALVVGFGMGVTSWSISRHGVQVDAIEISPGVIEANKFFTKINNNVLKDPLVKLYLDDGRNYVFATNKKYDMISTGIIHPLVSSNSSGFYTLDFYELCKKALTKNGVMCQWVPLHRLPEEHYKMIIRTFKKAFPHTTLWYKYTPDFCILIGTPEKLKIDYESFARRMENQAVKADLALVNMSDPICLLDSFMMDEDTVALYAGEGPLHTDDRPRIEFFGAKMGNTTRENIIGMGKFRTSIIPFLTNLPEEEKSIFQQYFNATQYAIAGQLYYVVGEYENAMRQYQVALDNNPEDENIRWLAKHVEKLMDYEALEEYKEIVRVQPDSATAHAGLGLLYQKLGRIDEAIAEMKIAIQLDPDIAVARINLGVMYEKKGMIDEAIEQIQAMVNMQTNSATIHGMLGDLYMKKGDFSRAESEFKKALEIDPEFGLVYHSFAELYLRQNVKLDEALRYAKKAIELNPAPGFIFTLANIYYKKGMLSDAEREIKRLIQMEPDNENYQEFLNKLRQ